MAHAAEQQRGDVKAAREAWSAGQLDLDPARLIFIDETSASTKMGRLYGRAARGERCLAAVPHGHWKTTTFTAGLRIGGLAGASNIERPTTIQSHRRRGLVARRRPYSAALI
jgi:hypothetical protein